MDWAVDDEWGEDDGQPSVEDLETGIDQVNDMVGLLADAATNDKTDLSSARRYKRHRARLNALLKRVDIKTPFGWGTLDEWRAFTKTRFPRDYAGRRAYVDRITKEVRTALEELLEEAEQGDLTSEVDELDEFVEEALEDPSGIRVELARLPGLLRMDLSAAVGKAKNLVEATAKAVLAAHGRQAPGHDFHKSANMALRALDLDPDPRGRTPEAEAMRLLKSLTEYVVNLRNDFGDGHGTVRAHTDVELRHARLAVRVAVTWCHFALETLHDQHTAFVDEDA